ncbi:MAG: hypothetical protein R2800_08055 [Flavipsychrobacter sp.]
MSNPMALSKNEIAKWLFIGFVGVISSYTGSMTQHEPFTISTAVYGAGGALMLTYMAGMLIYGIRRIFGKPNVQRSTLRHSLYYGFYFIMSLFVLQVILLVELLIMRG